MITDGDLKKLTKVLATKEDINSAKDDVKSVKGDIKQIRGDLVKHDERTEKIIEMIQDLAQWKRVDEKVERIREFLRKQHKVEV